MRSLCWNQEHWEPKATLKSWFLTWRNRTLHRKIHLRSRHLLVQWKISPTLLRIPLRWVPISSSSLSSTKRIFRSGAVKSLSHCLSSQQNPLTNTYRNPTSWKVFSNTPVNKRNKWSRSFHIWLRTSLFHSKNALFGHDYNSRINTATPSDNCCIACQRMLSPILGSHSGAGPNVHQTLWLLTRVM